MIYHNLLKKYINIFNLMLILVGIFMASWIIWVRFIRERLPKDIPFELTEIRFYLLVYACIIYLIIIYSLLSPKEPNKIIKKLVEILFLPLVTFDKFIKNNKYMNPKYIKFLKNNVRPRLLAQEWFIRLKVENRFIFFTIIPRCILISILLIEIFYFKRIEIFYSAIILGIFPLLHRYFKYSFKNIKEQYIYYFEQQITQIYLLVEDLKIQEDCEENPEKYTNIKYNDKYVSVHQYFEDILSDQNKIKYFASPEFTEQYLNKYISDKNKDISDKDKYIYENKLLNKKEILNETKIIERLQSKFRLKIISYEILHYYYELYAKATDTSYTKWLRIIIFSLYFICWFYILCVSFHTLNFEDMPITLNTLKIMTEFTKEDPYLLVTISFDYDV